MLQPRIDPVRFWSTVETSATIGVIPATDKHDPGLGRLTLTDDDKAVRDRFVAWCHEAGLTVRVDRMGSIVGRRAGQDETLPPVLLGSHLDTQQHGGRFDGVIGVLGALEVVRALNGAGIVTRRPIEIVTWTNEEGGRFAPPMVASGVYAGAYDLAWAHGIRDDDGFRLGDELARIGYADDAPCPPPTYPAAYLELHIEQGPVLDRENIQVGVVTHGMTVHGFRIAFYGETAHAGTRPMALRRNALVAAARLAVAIDDLGQDLAASGGMATVSRIVASPNKSGIVSDRAELTADIRHSDAATADATADRLLAAAQEAADTARCRWEVQDRWHWGGDIFDPRLVNVIRDTAEALGYTHRDLPSQAGHDAYFLARVCPTAMIFTPGRDGITHHPDEFTTLAETVPGVEVLLHATLAVANA